MELFLILVYRQKQLTNVTEYQILNAVGVLDLPLQLIWNSKGTDWVTKHIENSPVIQSMKNVFRAE